MTETKVDKNEGYVYFIKEFHTNTYKIGKSRNIENRLKLFSVKLPFEWELVHSIKSKDYSALEKNAHKFFADKRVNGEWFNLNDSDLEFIKQDDFYRRIKPSGYRKKRQPKQPKQTELNLSFDWFANLYEQKSRSEQAEKETIKTIEQFTEKVREQTEKIREQNEQILEHIDEKFDKTKIRLEQHFALEDALIAVLKEENEMIRQHLQNEKLVKKKKIGLVFGDLFRRLGNKVKKG